MSTTKDRARSLLVAATLFGLPPGYAGETAGIRTDVWLHLDSAWQAAPPEIGRNERWAYATLLRMSPHGTISMIGCTLREESGQRMISRGDGQIVHAGTWLRHGDVLEARLRLMYQAVKPTGGPKPPTAEEFGALRLAGDRLTFLGSDFFPAPDLDEDYAAVMAWVGVHESPQQPTARERPRTP